MNKIHKYAIEIFYSEEDEGYIAILPELPGCSAFGENAGDALKEAMVAMDLWLETAEKERIEIPQPLMSGKSFLNEIMNMTKIRQNVTA
ncbi:MAG: type II toxin-antitoxin system HicB family antitoxin [Candidatus Altiarchaeales archaeon HGW-Altiarchaeales-2]|nr:MAG: type II toxin-antitoxin system HicB family antitoxin [Candidatus Altiarchaeales archaeon HGW-Altiarchaeales-2]